MQLMQQVHRLTQVGAAEFSKFQLGITLRQAIALHHVALAPGSMQQDIANAMSIDRRSLRELMEHLVRDGYVQRKRPWSDRRRYQLVITEAGAELLQRAEKAAAAAELELINREPAAARLLAQ